MSLAAKIESLLLVSAKPLSLNELAKFLKAETTEVQAALQVVTQKYDDPECGIRLLRNDNKVQFASAAEHAKLVREFMHDETTGELTKPSLETLTIILYAGPLARPEIDWIRGVNSSFILRHLLIRGLVERLPKLGDARGYLYQPTFDLLNYLGVGKAEELPEYSEARAAALTALNHNQEDNDGQ